MLEIIFLAVLGGIMVGAVMDKFKNPTKFKDGPDF